MNTTDIQLANIHHTYPGQEQKRPTLTDVSVTVAGGELVGLVGPSGCGKSTLLHIAAGLLPVNSGTVRWGTQNVSALSANRIREFRLAQIALITQSYNLIGHDTVLNNVAIPLMYGPDKLPARKVRDQAFPAVFSVGLSAEFDKKVAELSGGQKQRVAVARALVRPRRYLIADEPTAALDHDNVLKICGLLRAAAQAGTAVLLATHDPRVAQLCDRVIPLRDGVITNDQDIFAMEQPRA